MVGVPTSKGCLLCRERHIGCDESRPQCAQCRRHGVVCPGYTRMWKFQDEGPRLQKWYKKRPVGRGSHAKTDADAVHRDVSMRKQIGTKSSIDERVYPALVHQAFINQQPRMFKEFVCAAFPTMFFHNEFRFGKGSTFPDWVVKHFGSKHYYDASVSCLSAEYLAHLTKDPRLHQFSRQKYSQALGATRQALRCSHEASSDDLLIAVILLSYYEMNVRTTPDAWVYHSRAVKQLMLKHGMDFHLSGTGRICHFAYRPFLIAAALCEGEPCFLGDDDWQILAATLREEDSQKQSQWSFYIDVYETIFMELVKCPGYIKETREIVCVFSPQAGLLAQRVYMTYDKLQMLTDELRSMLASANQRKEGIISSTFVGPEPSDFPETSPSLLLNAAVNAISILEQLYARLTMPAYVKEETPSSSGSTPSSLSTSRSVGLTDSGGPLFDFRFTYELGGTTPKEEQRSFTWLDRVAGSMGLLGAEIIYEDAVVVG
ncbi:hypothetical protein NUU61_009806 [Penicillium alfredii]|uniref:Zn(2)-C6 fungal-type domain-containing protein n=1 Tax=Penicillium alfredii TaxID=1506179 RepID=A0A9W9JUD2_9EURO|nr:uncharacterized protein NUU61_009806 [Penicillium alfredii]KAJ5081542.1 hypothetical protein NUU61_009806 [Penicillium alfredii]